MAKNEVLAAAKDVYSRGKRLIKMAIDLAGEYGIPESELEDAETNHIAAPEISRNGKKPRMSRTHREMQLAEWFRRNGPHTPNEIMAKADFPAGTLYRLLRSKIFSKGADGRWGLAEQTKAQ